MSIEALFDEYAEYHRSRWNRWAHGLGFPLMGLSLTGLAEAAGGLWLCLALQLGLAVLNVRTHPRLGGWCTVALAVLWLAGRGLSPGALGALLVAGLAMPVFTHVAIERRWPDTPDRFLRFERVGHLWFMGRLLRRLGRP